MRTRRPIMALMASVAMVLALPGVASASVSNTPDPTGDAVGSVWDIAKAGDRVIIGGLFTRFGGQARSNLAAVLPDGSADRDWAPTTNGIVKAVAVSTDGSTVYVGGVFSTVNGEPRANLAALDAETGDLLPTWVADTGGSYPDVNSFAVSGDRLYVGGRFTDIDGTTRKRLVALDTAGDVIPSFNPRSNGNVREVVVSADGTKVYPGGAFTVIGGQERLAHAAELLATDGSATSFNPTEEGGNVVTVALTPDGSRFFYSTENNTVFATDPAVSGAPVWIRKMSGNTQAMAASATGELYIGGHFSQDLLTKTKREFMGSLWVSTGDLTPWNPETTGGKKGVWAFLIDGDKLHTGGYFRYFGTTFQRGYARFSGTP